MQRPTRFQIALKRNDAALVGERHNDIKWTRDALAVCVFLPPLCSTSRQSASA